ncbi:MAG: hypothetical protein QW776_06660 [Candidatus Nitrosocaldus sp.]
MIKREQIKGALFLFIITGTITMTMVNEVTFGCTLVPRPDVTNRPSFLLELTIQGEVDKTSLLQDDIRQAFDIVRGSFISDVSEIVRDNIGKVTNLIPYYVEAEWSLNEEQYDLQIYYYDEERQFRQDLKNVFLKTSAVKLAHLSMNPLQSIVYLESDCKIFPVSAPSKEFNVWVTTLHNLGIETVAKYSNELSGSRIESISFERLNYTTGKVMLKLDSGIIEEFVYNDLSDLQGSSIPTPERPRGDTEPFFKYMIGYVASFAFLLVVSTVILFLRRKKHRQDIRL